MALYRGYYLFINKPLYFLSICVDNTSMIEQNDIFGHNQDSIHFAELCNALYQRECQTLATSNTTQVNLLKRKLKFLPQLVQECARSLCDAKAPLTVDYHNASYQGKQAAQCPALKFTPEQISATFQKLPDIGKVLPVLVRTIDGYHLELDSVDRIEPENQLIHVNKHGWFTTQGQFCELQPEGAPQLTTEPLAATLTKPTKAVMQAACCGHQWRLKGKGIPRALTLRELKLSFHIQW